MSYFSEFIKLTEDRNGMWPGNDSDSTDHQFMMKMYVGIEKKFGGNIKNWSKKALDHVSFKSLDYKAKSLSLKQTQQHHCIAITMLNNSSDFDNYGPDDSDWKNQSWIFWIDQMGIVASKRCKG